MRQRPLNPSLLWMLLLLLCAVGCKPTVPSEYIRPDDMEDILYDYHIAVSMAQNEGASDLQVKSWQLAVLKKHDVSEEKFNRSMLYYMRHTEKMHTIYEHLSNRLGEEAKALGVTDAELSQYGAITSRGDTADIWPGRKTLMLTPFAPYNKHSFTINVDTAFHKGDRLVLSFDSQFILQEGMRNLQVGLVVTYKNDSIEQKVQLVSGDARQTLTIEDRDNLGIKSIKGFFLLGRNTPSPTTTLTLLFASNIKFVRMHVKKPQGVEGSSNPMNPNTPIRTIGGTPAQTGSAPSAHTAPQHTTPSPTIPPTPINTMRQQALPPSEHLMKSVATP